MLKGKERSMSSQSKAVIVKDDRKRETFEFLVPEIPPLKNEKNIIPTGKQIPRTPLKCEIVISKPTETSDDTELCGILNDEEHLFKNMIPKGREIPRTPPNYCNIPFLMSGCQIKSSTFLQPIDLGVKPLEEVGELDDVAINLDNITVRKRPMPKTYNLDLVLSEMIEEVNIEDDRKGLLTDESQKESVKMCIPVVSDRASQDAQVLEQEEQQCASISNGEIAGNSLKDNYKHEGHVGVGESILKDVTKPSEEVVPKKKRGRARGNPSKSSVTSKQEKCRDEVVDEKKQGRCRSKSSAEVGENNSKEKVKCKDGRDSSLRDVNKQDEKIVLEKRKGRTRRVTKVSSLISNQEKECCDTEIKLEMDRSKENVFVTKQEVEKSLESSENGRRKCNKREKCSLPSDLQTRRNPGRRAKEGINYRLSQE